MHSDHFDLHAALVRHLSDREWAKRLSLGFGKYRDRSDANALRDPNSLSPLEVQFQLATRIGRHDRAEFGALLTSVKKQVGQASFEPWVRAFCLFSPRTACRYMRIDREWGAKPVEQGAYEPF